jgi:hypothetical protein
MELAGSFQPDLILMEMICETGGAEAIISLRSNYEFHNLEAVVNKYLS